MTQVPVWGWFSFGEMIVFVCVLLVGLIYVWMKGDLAWIRSKPLIPVTNTQVPASSYAAINAERFVVREFHLPEPAPAPAATTPTAAAKPAFKPGGKPAFKPGGARFKPGAARSKPETGNSAKDGNDEILKKKD